MTVEQLMQRRFMVIAEYPHCPFEKVRISMTVQHSLDITPLKEIDEYVKKYELL
jgi:hypothetical protein